MKLYVFGILSLGISLFAIYSGIRMNKDPESSSIVEDRGLVSILTKYKNNYTFHLSQSGNTYWISRDIATFNDQILNGLESLKDSDDVEVTSYQDPWQDKGTMTVTNLKINNTLIFDKLTFKQAQLETSYYAFGVGIFMFLITCCLVITEKRGRQQQVFFGEYNHSKK